MSIEKGIAPHETLKPIQTSKFASSEVLDTVKEEEIKPTTKGASK